MCADRHYDELVSRLESARIEWEQRMQDFCKVGSISKVFLLLGTWSVDTQIIHLCRYTCTRSYCSGERASPVVEESQVNRSISRLWWTSHINGFIDISAT